MSRVAATSIVNLLPKKQFTGAISFSDAPKNLVLPSLLRGEMCRARSLGIDRRCSCCDSVVRSTEDNVVSVRLRIPFSVLICQDCKQQSRKSHQG